MIRLKQIPAFYVFIPMLLIWNISVCQSHSSPSYFKPAPSFVAESGLGTLGVSVPWQSKLTVNPPPEKMENDLRKSKGRAIFLSFLIPGLGEHYAGRTIRARSFFIAEVLLWTAYSGFKIYENWLEDEYKVFAATHANINPADKPHKYFVNVGNYDNIYDYNAVRLNYRDLENVYAETSEYYWQWDNAANKHDFKMMRLRADNGNYRALFTLGTILVNHLISAIDAVWVTRVTAKSAEQAQQTLKFRLETSQEKYSCQLVLTKSF